MDQSHTEELPRLHADIEALRQELEQLHRTARSAGPERREAEHGASGGIVIRGK